MHRILHYHGVRQGLWLEFHDSGTIKEKIYYENGWFLEGYSYDTKGNLIATHHGNRDMILTKPVE